MDQDKNFTEYKGIRFHAIGEYFSGKPIESDLFSLLAIEKSELRVNSYKLLGESSELLSDLNWGIKAYLQFQDILSISLSKDESELPINRHYCYYESIIYLKESIKSLLDKNILASIVLLRPFLELSFNHIYWFLKCEQKGYGKYYLWLTGLNNSNFSFNTVINKIFKLLTSLNYIEQKRIKNLKKIFLNFYSLLCNYNHSHHLDYSLTVRSGFSEEISLEDFYYIPNILNIILNQLIYLYINVFPMSIFPVDIYKKYGFNGPMGLFFDIQNFKIIEKFIGAENLDKMKTNFENADIVINFLKFFNESPDLTNIEIDETWNSFCQRSNMNANIKKMEKRIAYFKAFQRSLGWAMNYINIKQDFYKNISDEVIEKIKDSLLNW